MRVLMRSTRSRLTCRLILLLLLLLLLLLIDYYDCDYDYDYDYHFHYFNNDEPRLDALHALPADPGNNFIY